MRKLLLIACGYVAALLAAVYLLPTEWLLRVGGGLAVLGIAALFLRKELRRAAALVLLSAAVGFGWYWGYQRLFVFPAEKKVGETRTALVRCCEYPTEEEDYSSVVVRCVDGTLPRARMLVYDSDGFLGNVSPGDLTEITVRLSDAGVSFGRVSTRYLSDGILLRGYLTDSAEVAGRAKLGWLYFPLKISRAIKSQAMACFPADTAPLMKALLTGDKQDLYEDDALYSAFRTTGFSHVVAVSGLHVGFLIALLAILTGRRRMTALLGIPIVVVFMAMMGFTPSVVRAGVMQILLLAAPLLRRENDPPTALAAAAMLLLLVNPIAVAGAGFQLSFSAMAGLILLTPGIYRRMATKEDGNSRFGEGIFGRAARKICATAAASLGALVFTAPITALWFGIFPLWSLLTNLLCLWAMSGAFMLGFPVCLLGLLWPSLGKIFGWLVGWLPRYAAFMVKLIARLPLTGLSTRGTLGGWWLIFAYLAFFGSWIFRGKGKRFRPVLPICAVVIMLSAVLLFPSYPLSGTMEFSAVDVGQGQCLAAMTDRSCVLIDCGCSDSEVNAGDAAANYLLSRGFDRVELLVLTHFHADHANGVERLLNRTKVERLAYPVDCEQNAFYGQTLALCEARGVTLVPVEQNTVVTVDDLRLHLYAPSGTGDANERSLLVYGEYGDFEFLVTGDAGKSVEREFVQQYAPGELELLVVGHHGSRYSTDEEFLEELRPETAIISVGEGNPYGHPTEEILERLEKYDTEIYRTDLDGTVTIIVGEN